MYNRFELEYIKREINIYDNIADELQKDLYLKRINSYIVYSNIDNFGCLVGYIVQYNVSEHDKFNGLKMTDVYAKLNDALELDAENPCLKRVVTYGQSDLNVMCKMYKPMIIKFAKEQCERWAELDMDDAVQMCNLVLCDLYYKKYYIHRNLLRRAYVNYVLMYFKKDRYKPIIQSLDDKYSKSEDDAELTIKDMVPDVQLINEQEDSENLIVEQRIINEMREILVNYIGQRQYDQLLREYGNKQTTNWSRKLMMDIKAYLFELGITAKSFANYYN